MTVKKVKARVRRHFRVRKRVRGSAERPRLAVFRSNRHIYAQVIDDLSGRTLVAASTLDEGVTKAAKAEAAKSVGLLVGKRAKESGIDAVVFDRGGYKYGGRVAQLADGAREAGLKF